jgi:hypothetical protein
MGKKSKAEKLKQILSELQKLKGELKSLGKQQANLAVQVGKLSSKKPTAKPVRKPAAKKAKPAPPAAKKAVAPKRPRPVLVSPPDAAPPASKVAGN